jgi:hypothetical protein
MQWLRLERGRPLTTEEAAAALRAAAEELPAREDELEGLSG